MHKIVTLKNLAIISRQVKSKYQTIGLITGCFDIVHPGHLGLFRFAKENCDILVVGLENDETIRDSKGHDRPVFFLSDRLNFLSELLSVDYVFPIEFKTKFASADAQLPYQEILNILKPDYLITNQNYDQFWQIKQEMIEKSGGKILLDKSQRDISTSKIASLIIKNFS